MSIFIAIVGLGVLILVHELGHFGVAVATGMRPRKFYIGFPPAIVKTTRKGIEYGIGAVPLGGFVKIPGMHRPAAADASMYFGRAVDEAPELVGPVERLRRALDVAAHDTAREALAEVRTALSVATLSESARRGADRGLTELSDALGPDAYWRAGTWRRVAVILAGPAANVALALVVFSVLLMQDTYRIGVRLGAADNAVTTRIDSIVQGSPAELAGLRGGDRIVRVDGRQVDANELLNRIQNSKGRPLSLQVQRAGKLVRVGPLRAEGSGGLSPPAAGWRSIEITGLVTKEIGNSLGRLVTGSGRKDISSPVGIVQGSSEAAKQGTANYLWVIGLVSLSLALLNLLPLLPLDGGHIVFSLLEGIRGRAVAREVYERVSAVGIALVLLLFFIGLSNDIGRLGG